MAASYPGAIKSFTTKTNNVDDVDAADMNAVQDEINAIETELGINVDDRLIKAWAHIDMATTTPVASEGVSSLDDNGTGLFDVNWTNAFSGDNDYACVASCQEQSSTGQLVMVQTLVASYAPIRCQNISNAVVDNSQVSVIAIGPLA